MVDWHNMFFGPQAKTGSPISNWWKNVSSGDVSVAGHHIPNAFHGIDQWFSGMNDAPTPGYDNQGNPIGGTPVGYENPNRLTDAYQAGLNTYKGSADAFDLGPQDTYLDMLMKGVMAGSPGHSGNAEGAAAASAFNPVFASLAAEKASAKKRGAANQKDIKGAYAALKQDYTQQAAAEVKGHAKATKEQNKAFAKDVYETGEQYTKIKAESDSEAARLGQTGTSAQQIADQKIAMASAGAVDLAKYQNNMNKAASDEISKSQENYMKRGAPIATQAGAEQVNLSKNKLEDVLLGLSREEAQAKMQQAAARISAKNAAYQAPKGPDIGDILAISGEKRAIQNDWIDNQLKLNPNQDPTKLKGLISANSWGKSAGVPSANMEDFMNRFQQDADINNGTYEDPNMPGTQIKMSKEMKISKIYNFAVQAGISTAKARQMAEIYARG